MTEKTQLLLQKNKISMFLKNTQGFELLNCINWQEDEFKKIRNKMERRREKTSYASSELDFTELVEWIICSLQGYGFSNELYTCVKNCYMWIIKIKVFDLRETVKSLLEDGDICIVDSKKDIGIYVGVDEDKYFISIKKPESD